jgi:hypothetical protein
VHTSHIRPDAVTMQLDPAMSLGLSLDDFLGVGGVMRHALWSYVTTPRFTRTGRIFWTHRVDPVPIPYLCE